jgi:hypothetical protein
MLVDVKNFSKEETLHMDVSYYLYPCAYSGSFVFLKDYLANFQKHMPSVTSHVVGILITKSVALVYIRESSTK